MMAHMGRSLLPSVVDLLNIAQRGPRKAGSLFVAAYHFKKTTTTPPRTAVARTHAVVVGCGRNILLITERCSQKDPRRPTSMYSFAVAARVAGSSLNETAASLGCSRPGGKLLTTRTRVLDHSTSSKVPLSLVALLAESSSSSAWFPHPAS